MFLKPNQNLTAFFEAVHNCSGDVNFISEEGDLLNLKSQLSQFIFLAAYVTNDFPLKGTISCCEPQDLLQLKLFLE